MTLSSTSVIVRGGVVSSYISSSYKINSGVSLKEMPAFSYPSLPKDATLYASENQTIKNTIIMRKNYYEEPQAELIVVRFEENILSGGIPDIKDDDVENDSENWG